MAGKGDVYGVALVLTRAGILAPMVAQNVVSAAEVDAHDGQVQVGAGASRYVMAPVALGEQDGEAWQLPIDPVVSVGGTNVITRRYVAKGSMRGTIKESFSQDDWSVEISGVLIGEDEEELSSMMAKMRELLDSTRSLKVESDYLNGCFGITNLVIESYSFPYTKGMSNQAYQLKCYSDESYELLEKL